MGALAASLPGVPISIAHNNVASYVPFAKPFEDARHPILQCRPINYGLTRPRSWRLWWAVRPHA